jgi:uncharacterized SAM-binding protein YcdF (DUF218 family)
MLMTNKWTRRVVRVFKYFVYTLGFIFLFLILFAFTRIPFDIHYWLGTANSAFYYKPDYIILLGGSGMPSESNLMRLYYTSELAGEFSEAPVIIAHPTDTAIIHLMCLELEAHGVDSCRIIVEKYGTNTREQALEIAGLVSGIKNKKVVLVTSMENMYRSIKVFRKSGFKYVGGRAAFENSMFVDLSYNHKRIGGKEYLPDVSESMSLRYTFWNYLKLEITCLREFTAIAYYKLNGWI